jgi:DNA-binding NarL/FixJ family response regulator
LIAVAVGQFGCVIGRGLLSVLDEDRGVRVVGADLDHAGLERAVARRKADVLFLDEESVTRASLPRRLCGAPRGGPHPPGRGRTQSSADVGLVVLAHRPTRAYAARAIALGVAGCLSTDASAAEISRALRVAAAGEHVFVALSPRGAAAGAVGGWSLTRRERQVLELLSRGQKNAEIARELNVSVETARTHAKHVYRKLGVGSRLELLGVEP